MLRTKHFFLYLNTLVGVAHHGNEEVDQDYGGDQQVESKNYLEELQSPVINAVGHFQVLWPGQTKEGEEEPFQSLDWGRAGSAGAGTGQVS